MAAERRITPPLTTSETVAARLGVAVRGLMWLILPGLMYLLGFVWPAPAFVLHPKQRASADARRNRTTFQPSDTVVIAELRLP